MNGARRFGLWKVVPAAWLAVMPPAGPAAQPEVTESIERYEVRGSTAAELKRELARLGPRSGSRSYGGLTKWELTWTFAFDETDTECRLASFDVRVDSVTTLPLWVPGGDAREKLVARWARFLDALVMHEERHRRFGREAASAVERRMNTVAASSTCEALETAIAATSRETVEHFHGLERRYDEETRHGRAEGARF